MKKPLWWWIATWFGSGLSPIVSGTVGSAAALPFAYAIHVMFGGVGLLIASLVIFAVGCWASQQFIDKSGKGNDPGEIVADEVAGMWLVMWGALASWPSAIALPDWLAYTVGFILFRVFDIIKPWPVSWADRKVKGGLGVMLDDILAAVYAIIVIVAYRLICFHFDA